MLSLGVAWKELLEVHGLKVYLECLLLGKAIFGEMWANTYSCQMGNTWPTKGRVAQNPVGWTSSFIGFSYRNIGKESFIGAERTERQVSLNPAPVWKSDNQRWKPGIHYATCRRHSRLETIFFGQLRWTELLTGSSANLCWSGLFLLSSSVSLNLSSSGTCCFYRHTEGGLLLTLISFREFLKSWRCLFPKLMELP